MSASSSPPAIVSRHNDARTMHFDASLPADLVEAFWTNPQAVAASGKPLQAKINRRALLVEWGTRQYVLKHYVEATWHDTLKHSLELTSRAWRSWFAAHRLADAGVRTPRPVICVEDFRGRIRSDSFMMYPYVEGRTLRSVFADSAHSHLAVNIWQQLRHMWSRLAEVRMSLTDTNVRNFILAPDGALWVIDLDRTRRHWSSLRVASCNRRGWKRLTRTATQAQKTAA